METTGRTRSFRMATAWSRPHDRGRQRPPSHCRRIVIRLRYGIKGGCDRRATSTGLDHPAPSRPRDCRRTTALCGYRARLTLLSCQATKARRICCAAAKCSNQTDLHLTFIDPIRPAGLHQRPSLTFLPLATDQTAALAAYGNGGGRGSHRTQ